MDAAALLDRSRLLAGLSRSEVAAIADVAASTVTRIERGEMSPTVDMLERLLSAAGYRLDVDLEQTCDITVVAAARAVLEGRADESALWIERWVRAGLLDGERRPKGPRQARRLAEMAGHLARVTRRPGLVSCAAVPIAEVARRLMASDQRFAITGGVAANRIVASASVAWFPVYVEDVRVAIESCGLELTTQPGTRLALIPFDETTSVGIELDEVGIGWAAPVQVLIDCFGGPGRMPEQADAIADVLYGSAR
jgi:transcriptional regulator with XRE-family HTH domain